MKRVVRTPGPGEILRIHAVLDSAARTLGLTMINRQASTFNSWVQPTGRSLVSDLRYWPDTWRHWFLVLAKLLQRVSVNMCLGRKWGLRRMATPAGHFNMMAVDQRHRIAALISKEPGIGADEVRFADMVAVKRMLVQELGGHASAVFMHHSQFQFRYEPEQGW